MTKSHSSKGFTVVELLVCIVIIGLLIAISYVRWNNWRNNVAINEVKSDLNSVGAAMTNEKNFQNAYPLIVPTSVTPSDNVQLTYVSGDATSYCIQGKSKVISSVVYYMSSSRSAPATNTCP